jgi:hypothetical protein
VRWKDGIVAFVASSGGTAYFDHAEITETRTLGSFEYNLDGWGTDSGSSLGRVHQGTEPAPITHGEYALEVAINGDIEPIIHTPGVRSAALSNHPCLLADGPATPSAVAAQVDADPEGAAVLLGFLDSAGYVERDGVPASSASGARRTSGASPTATRTGSRR